MTERGRKTHLMTWKEWEEVISYNKDDKRIALTLELMLFDWRAMMDEIESHLYFTWRFESDQKAIRDIIDKELGR